MTAAVTVSQATFTDLCFAPRNKPVSPAVLTVSIPLSKETIMKTILFVTTAVTVLAAVSQAFATSPAYEAAWDYDGLRAAQSAHAGKRFTPWEAVPVLKPNGHTSTFKSGGRR
jgi:hypothetical protein